MLFISVFVSQVSIASPPNQYHNRSPTPSKCNILFSAPLNRSRRHRYRIYFLVVKSISLAGLKPPSAAFSQVQPPKTPQLASNRHRNTKHHIPAGRDPQAQVEPVGVVFSVAARSHVHSPAGRARHEHRGPLTVFSEAALEHVHWRADF